MDENYAQFMLLLIFHTTTETGINSQCIRSEAPPISETSHSGARGRALSTDVRQLCSLSKIRYIDELAPSPKPQHVCMLVFMQART